jgi:hypothetical protein
MREYAFFPAVVKVLEKWKNGKIEQIVYFFFSSQRYSCRYRKGMHACNKSERDILKCIICYEYYPAANGLNCGERNHFVCDKDLDQWVHTRVEQDLKNIERSIQTNSKIKCPAECDAHYAETALARHVSEDTFAGRLGLFHKISEHKAMVNAHQIIQAENERLREELRRGQLTSSAVLIADQLRRSIPDARQCANCGFGPVDPGQWCTNMETHHGQLVDNRTKDSTGCIIAPKMAQIRNACPRCSHASQTVAGWPSWNGQLPQELLDDNPSCAVEGEPSTQPSIAIVNRRPPMVYAPTSSRAAINNQFRRERARLLRLCPSPDAAESADDRRRTEDDHDEAARRSRIRARRAAAHELRRMRIEPQSFAGAAVAKATLPSAASPPSQLGTLSWSPPPLWPDTPAAADGPEAAMEFVLVCTDWAALVGSDGHGPDPIPAGGATSPAGIAPAEGVASPAGGVAAPALVLDGFAPADQAGPAAESIWIEPPSEPVWFAHCEPRSVTAGGGGGGGEGGNDDDGEGDVVAGGGGEGADGTGPGMRDTPWPDRWASLLWG